MGWFDRADLEELIENYGGVDCKMIPDFQTLMLPVLEACADGAISTGEVVDRLEGRFEMTEEERWRRTSVGRPTVFYNRVYAAKKHLRDAGLIRYPARGQHELTAEGRRVLQEKPERIDLKFLEQFETYLEFKERRGTRSGKAESAENHVPAISVDAPGEVATPDETLRQAYKAIQDTLAADLLDRVRNSTPQFFEELIVDLLLSMGYGGPADDAGRVLGGSGDDGVDGVIDQDPLGVDQVYVQAKRYKEDNAVGAPAIRDFFGAVNLKKAQKGIFFTSSAFSPSARAAAEGFGMRIVLIDGERLAKLMIKYNIGCREEETIRLKRVDEEYFEPGS